MKKLLTLLLTIVMAISLVNLNNNYTKAENSPNANEDYLTFTAEEANSTVGIGASGSWTGTSKPLLQIRINNGGWNDYIIGTTADIVLTNVGDFVQFKATSTNNYFSYSEDDCLRFRFSGKIAVTGNIMSLLDSSCASTTIPSDYCFNELFINASQLTSSPKLPATTLTNACYQRMFAGCSSLTKAPELPATTLKDSCYMYMFASSGLIDAPNLPAEILDINCYAGMFYNCANLIKAPKLPAMNLKDYCYSSMFDSCGSLIEAPELPAKTLAEGCYNHMFANCSDLKIVPELPATTLAKKCYCEMFLNCEDLTDAPELPATTLAESCYQGMFKQCTSLIETPELQATTLEKQCYKHMFCECTGLKIASDLNENTLKESCYEGMYMGCSDLVVAPKLKTSTLDSYCYYEMFSGCASLKVNKTNDLADATILLPANTVTMPFDNMFSGTIRGAGVDETPATGYYVAGLKKLISSDFNYKAPSNLQYDGTPKTADVTLKSGIAGVDNVEVVYYKGKEKLSSAPSEVGTYTVKVNATCSPTSEYATRKNITDKSWTFTISNESKPADPTYESCEKVIGPTWHWNNSKGICEDYGVVGTSTR